MNDPRECAYQALLRLLAKLHAETDCGRDGSHWTECEAARDDLEELGEALYITCI